MHWDVEINDLLTYMMPAAQHVYWRNMHCNYSLPISRTPIGTGLKRRIRCSPHKRYRLTMESMDRVSLGARSDRFDDVRSGDVATRTLRTSARLAMQVDDLNSYCHRSAESARSIRGVSTHRKAATAGSLSKWYWARECDGKCPR